MNDHEAETLAHAVSNSDDLCLPTDPEAALMDMKAALWKPRNWSPSGYHEVNLRGYKLDPDGRVIDGKRLKRERNRRIIDLYEAGNTPAEISAMVQLGVSSIWKIIARGY
jgi:hypothetical protein